jgi:hypothetical protein
MKYLISATVIYVLFAVLVLTDSAFADRDRDRVLNNFEYIGDAGNCKVYHKRHNNAVVFVTWGTNCAVSAT